MSEKKPFQRLPTSVVPLVYDLTLKPDLSKFTFEGKEKIDIEVKEETQTITLNVNEIVIAAEGLTVAYPNKTIGLEKIDYSTENETATLTFKEKLPTGEARLSLNFTGLLNDKMKGFYRSKYDGPDGQTRHIAVTQFEATDARRAFPSWDEPAIKAKFDITLVVPNDGGKTTALSNMSVKSETVTGDNNGKIVAFHQTPIMSTYLVAFIVGEFDFLESKSGDGVKIRVYTPVGKAEQGRFALDMTGKALDYYRDYFGIPYPLDKMDLIAISDFAAGAMENWGLVTYRETCLLVDPTQTSTARRQWVALVVAHELAHQWFGNLVTMEWWTHLWLNEGFASFIEYLCVDKLYPEYNIWSQFVADTFLEALELDGLDNSHPIEVPVGHPSEVDEIFDDISYAKGASVIRMLHRMIGDDTFRKGMHAYLTKFSYKNTQTEDLWDALEEASKKPVRRVMSTWTKQKGYPVITVTATSAPGGGQVVSLSQEKFNLNGTLSEEDKKSLWAVPVEIVSAKSPTETCKLLDTLLETRDLKVNLMNISSDEWFKLNPSSVGTYRVCYSPQLLARFEGPIKSGALPPLDRLSLLSDLFALVQSGSQSTVDLLKFIAAFEGELDYTVWRPLNDILGKLNQLFAGSDFHEDFRKFARKLVNRSVWSHCGWQPKANEPHLDTLLRSLIVGRLVSLGDEAVLAHAQALFASQVEGKEPILADLRGAVYRGVASQADEATYEVLLKMYRNADLQEEKNRVSTSLGGVKKPELIERVLQFALSEEVRSQDAVFVIGSVAANPVGREAAWQFFQANKATFIERYGSGSLCSRLIKLVTDNFASEAKAVEVENFFKSNTFPGSERSLQQSIETIRLNAAILKRDAAAVKAYLASL